MWEEPIPLFPLKAVLFPGMALPLHIFEERYKAMVNRCIDGNAPFGVVLIRDGTEVGPPAEPVNIGTLAQIRAVERLPEGRMMLITQGTKRFRLVDYLEATDHYLMGLLEPLSDEPGDPTTIEPLAEEVTRLFGAYLRVLLAMAGQKLPAYELPKDPVDLSFMIAGVIQADADDRQGLLEMTDTAARLEHERTVLERETERLEAAYKKAAEEPPKPLTAKLDGIEFGSRN